MIFYVYYDGLVYWTNSSTYIISKRLVYMVVQPSYT